MKSWNKKRDRAGGGFLGRIPIWICAIAALGVSACATSPEMSSSVYWDLDDQIPVTEKAVNDDAEDFTFAIVADLSGGERPGIFNAAVSRINLFRPAFVMSVGDLIDGAPQNEEQTEEFWNAFDAKVGKLQAPFFYAVGNHDIYSANTREIWEQRYGDRYYHFVYKDTLFLVLDTEDYDAENDPTAFELDNLFPDSVRDEFPDYVEKYGLEKGARKFIGSLDWDGTLDGAISDEQVSYVANVLAENTDVRHTFVFMHQPMWQGDVLPAYAEIERALAGRPYTAFSGHAHHYKHTDRNGAMHIRLGTTGGGWVNKDIDGSFDHITLVTMSQSDPHIANIRLDGIFDHNGYGENDHDELCFSERSCSEQSEEE